MAKIQLMGAALVAAAVVAGCCDRENCKGGEAEAAGKQAEAAPAPAAKDPNEAVLTVNGKKLTRGELDADVEKAVASNKNIPAGQVEMAKQYFANQFAQEFLVNTVLGKKAADLGFACTDEDLKARADEILAGVKGSPDAPKSFDELIEKHPLGKDRALADLKSSIAIDKMLKEEIKAKTDAKDYSEKVQAFIADIAKKNESIKDSDEAALKRIKELKAELDQVPEAEKAAKFAQLAEVHSACPSGKKGGDLGKFGHGQMVKEFDEVSFAQEVGQISDPVRTQFGYHLILTTQKFPAKTAQDGSSEPEMVQASHILIKVDKPQEVPSPEEVTKFLKKSDEREIVKNFILDALRNSDLTAADEFKQFLPPPATDAENTDSAVEKPAGK